MYDLGWTRPGFFDEAEDEMALHHATARYHAFLDLMASSPASFFVPTLDIDLVWHTHQLMPGKYQADCSTYVHQFIDHDDKVEGLKLSSSFDATCRAWMKRFGVRYSHSYTAPPPAPAPHLSPYTNRADVLGATHPSDHNAVHFDSHSKSANETTARMYAELKAAKKEAARKADKDAISHGATSMPPHSYGQAWNSRGWNRTGFRPAFLVPVPLIAMGAADAGCVAVHGTTVAPPVGCASVSRFYLLAAAVDPEEEDGALAAARGQALDVVVLVVGVEGARVHVVGVEAEAEAEAAAVEEEEAEEAEAEAEVVGLEFLVTGNPY
ncbi:unnamed protein product [Cyclocybe aegerita]|uniref:Glycine-rich domain-containing protein-like n=1 Tax=Cyclocybe aegerita TaxID=1973307 RepID=A0A8S0XKJ0_CYCAE|nr:unnamed protein product [Cyclocybe aegerita]